MLEQQGIRVTYLPVQKNGIVDLNKLREVITHDTALVSVMLVNNEIGVVQPIAEIGKICREQYAKLPPLFILYNHLLYKYHINISTLAERFFIQTEPKLQEKSQSMYTK